MSKLKNNDILKKRVRKGAQKWEFSSAGRASALQAEGHRFEPYNSHQKLNFRGGLTKKRFVFENAGVAQLVEHCLAKAVVASSSLVSRST